MRSTSQLISVSLRSDTLPIAERELIILEGINVLPKIIDLIKALRTLSSGSAKILRVKHQIKVTAIQHNGPTSGPSDGQRVSLAKTSASSMSVCVSIREETAIPAQQGGMLQG